MHVVFDKRFWWKYPIPTRLYVGGNFTTWKWLCFLAEVS